MPTYVESTITLVAICDTTSGTGRSYSPPRTSVGTPRTRAPAGYIGRSSHREEMHGYGCQPSQSGAAQARFETTPYESGSAAYAAAY